MREVWKDEEIGVEPKTERAVAAVQFSEDGYRIRVGEEYSQVMDLGEPIEWVDGHGVRYLAFCDLEGGGDAQGEGDATESRFEHWLYEGTPVEDAVVEDVEGFEEELTPLTPEEIVAHRKAIEVMLEGVTHSPLYDEEPKLAGGLAAGRVNEGGNEPPERSDELIARANADRTVLDSHDK